MVSLLGSESRRSWWKCGHPHHDHRCAAHLERCSSFKTAFVLWCVVFLLASAAGIHAQDTLNLPKGEMPASRSSPGAEREMRGCTVPSALNFDPDATIEDMSCCFVLPCVPKPPPGSAPIPGCLLPWASNYNAAANVDDGSCIFGSPPPATPTPPKPPAPPPGAPDRRGCMNPTASNFDELANVDDGNCKFDEATDVTTARTVETTTAAPKPGVSEEETTPLPTNATAGDSSAKEGAASITKGSAKETTTSTLPRRMSVVAAFAGSAPPPIATPPQSSGTSRSEEAATTTVRLAFVLMVAVPTVLTLSAAVLAVTYRMRIAKYRLNSTQSSGSSPRDASTVRLVPVQGPRIHPSDNLRAKSAVPEVSWAETPDSSPAGRLGSNRRVDLDSMEQQWKDASAKTTTPRPSPLKASHPQGTIMSPTKI